MDRTFVVSLALSDRLGKDTFQAYSVSAPNVASASDTAVQRAKGLGLSLDETREAVYGMPYDTWKQLYQREAAPDQQKQFAAVMADPTKHG